MEALLSACNSGALSAEIGCVISNRADAGGLKTARDHDIETAVVPHTEFPTRDDFDRALAARVLQSDPELVVLAGFMRILGVSFLDHFDGRLMNIHPSLLPKYPGLNTHQRAIDNGDRHGGATVHYTTGELDGGPPIIQAREPIGPDDNADALAARVLRLEHSIYPLAVQWHVTGRLDYNGGEPLLDGEPLPETGYLWQSQ